MKTATATAIVASLICDLSDFGRYTGYNHSVRLVLDARGENPRLYHYATIGGGVSSDIWHGREVTIAWTPKRCESTSLERWLRRPEVTELVQQIASLYKGDEWNGSNWVGQWGEGLGALIDSFEEWLRDALVDGVIREWQDAEDYFCDHSVRQELITEALAASSLDEYAAQLVETAAVNDCLLDAEDVKEFLENGLLVWIEEEDPRYERARELLK